MLFKYGDVYVNISPIGITVEKVLSTEYADTMMFTDVFFRMQNGEIKTYNQITSYKKLGMLMKESKDKRYRYDAQFFDTIPLSNFKSIIVGNIEYEINDPSKTSYVNVDKKLYPFKLSADIAESNRYFVPIQELCEKLGADIEWFDGKISAAINYQGRIVEASTLKDTYINFGDGRPYNPRSALIVNLYSKLKEK